MPPTTWSHRFRALAAVLVVLLTGLVPAVALSASGTWGTTHPTRVLDTRVGARTIDWQHAGDGKRAAGSTLELQIAGRAGVPDHADKVILNLTAVNPDTNGHFRVYRCGGKRPGTSSLNYSARRTQSNLVIAEVGTGGRVCIYSSARTDVVADLQGYTAGVIDGNGQSRLLDTRDSGRRAAGSTLKLQVTGRAGVPTNAETVILNLTAVNPGTNGHLRAYPCDRARPESSNVNYSARTNRSNLVITRTDNQGRVCIYTSAPIDIVADVQGYATDAIKAIDPARVLDSRNSGRRNATSTLQLQVTGRAGIPKSADTVMLNLAAVNPDLNGHLRVYPCDGPRPETSSLNYAARSTQANLVIARTDSQGRVCIYTSARTDIVVDLQGYVAMPTELPPPVEQASGFVHPGVLVSRAQLDEIRANVAAGREPWASAVDGLSGAGGSMPTELRSRSYSFSSLSYVPAPVPVIQAGGKQSYLDAHGLENIGGQEHVDDARAAYTHALLWYITGNQAHADKAIQIMNAWSSTLVEIKFDSPTRVDNGWPVFGQGKLQAGWGGSLFARSAEIIRYSGAGWSNADIARFETLLHDVYLPLVITGWTNGANWMMTFAEATISIGVFTNDRNAFDAGVAMWREKAPTTIYQTSDGPHPIPSASYLDTPSEIRANWYDPSWYPNGLQQETMRDLGHVTMGLGALANAAETAYIQGVNLYGEQSSRIIAGNERNAGYVNDYLDEIARRGGSQPSSTWIPGNWPGAPGSFDIGNNFYKTGWAVAHHHYTTRAGTSMPETSRLLQRLGQGANRADIHNSWEILTHS